MLTAALVMETYTPSLTPPSPLYMLGLASPSRSPLPRHSLEIISLWFVIKELQLYVIPAS